MSRVSTSFQVSEPGALNSSALDAQQVARARRPPRGIHEHRHASLVHHVVGRHGDCATRARAFSTVASASSTITYEFQKAPTFGHARHHRAHTCDQLPVLKNCVWRSGVWADRCGSSRKGPRRTVSALSVSWVMRSTSRIDRWGIVWSFLRRRPQSRYVRGPTNTMGVAIQRCGTSRSGSATTPRGGGLPLTTFRSPGGAPAVPIMAIDQGTTSNPRDHLQR